MDRVTQQIKELMPDIPMIQANDCQLEQINYRIRQIVLSEEFLRADRKKQIRWIKQVWPIAQYVDRESQ